jgi:ElaB/YqjD/DUF883 family membrane-anchored ribosome-binding protein
VGQSTEELTRDIEQTRRNLSQDVDELSDKVSPGRIVQRRKEAATSKLRSVRESVMGSAQDSVQSMSSTGQSVGDTASGAVQTIEDRAQGNPLAAGLVAFGAGMVLGSLIPASRTEAQATRRTMHIAREQGQPVIDEAKAAGQELAQQLKQSAGEAAQEVKSSAQDSAQHVTEEAKASGEHVKDAAPGT